MVEPASVPMDFVEIETAHAAETKEADDVFDHDEDEGFAHPEAADAEVDASGLLHDDEDVRADEASRPDEPNIAEETNDTVQMFGKVQLCAPQPRCTMIGCLEAPFLQAMPLFVYAARVRRMRKPKSVQKMSFVFLLILIICCPHCTAKSFRCKLQCPGLLVRPCPCRTRRKTRSPSCTCCFPSTVAKALDVARTH